MTSGVAPTAIHAGASDESSVIGGAPKGASYTTIATYGPGTEVKLDGVEYLIMKESDIMGVIEQTVAHKKAA